MYELTVTDINPIRTKPSKVPIPDPGPHDLCIAVIATTSNPKDWQYPVSVPSRRINEGDDISGTVHSVGSSVTEFHPGDRVAALHRMGTTHGSYSQYAIAPASTTFHIPANLGFEEAATVPLTAMTAALALFQHLGLPLPWETSTSTAEKPFGPLLIYGGASTVGAFALKLAKLVKQNKHLGLGPIITVAGTDSILFVKGLNAADYVVDYRTQDVVKEIEKILAEEEKELRHAFDAISHSRTWENIVPTLAKSGGPVFLNMVDPPEVPVEWPANLVWSRTFVAAAYGEADPDGFRNAEDAAKDADFAYVMYRYLGRMMGGRKLETHPYQIMENGLESVARGMQMLQDGKVHGKKLVYRIADTPGLEMYQG